MHHLAGRKIARWRVIFPANRLGITAARRKVATLRRMGGRRQIPFQPDELPLPAIHARHGRKQGLSIGVTGRAQHFIRRAALDDAPQIHHANLVCQIVNHRQIVRDKQIAQLQLLLQLLE